MVQSGIAYAAGQLLAVVAPRTVLVVDAPTDWSLAGPLWELALDDAPVDEILDVLIRRGIRTAPSFAIVRVENDAVRALVRGSVPVCFERVGEPVRLDATGATTWLEGLISSARRVLVGAVETNTTLPYLVSTGVVLVSGLALPCGPADRETPAPGAPEASGEPDGAGSPSEPASYFARPAATPVASGSYAAPTAGREPRVVDLTRSGGRTPARAFAAAAPESRDSRALASTRSGGDGGGRAQRELNGHAPTGLDASALSPAPVASAFEPAATFEPTPVNQPNQVVESRASPYPYPYVPDPLPTPAPEPAAESALRSEPAAPAPEAAPAASAAPAAPAESRSRFDPIDFSTISADDPGELQDLDEPAQPEPSALSVQPETESPQLASSSERSAAPKADDFFSANRYSALDDHSADQQPGLAPEPDASAAESLDDDLLIEPADDEQPRGPSPVDLPNLDPPSLSLAMPGLNGHGSAGSAALSQPRGFSRAPANWPPAPEPVSHDAVRGPGARTFEGVLTGSDQAFSEDDRSVGEYVEEAGQSPSAGQSAAKPNFTWVAPKSDRQNDAPAESPAPSPQADASSNFLPPVLRPDAEQPPLGELPLRIRGRSLRPEQRPNGGRLLVGPDGDQPEDSPPPFRANNDNRFRDAGSANSVPGLPGPATDAAGSGSLLLPAFFRGARAARKPDAEPGVEDAQIDDLDADGPASWIPGATGPAAPAAWVPPVRRGAPERSGSGFNGGPPAMPGAPRSPSSDDYSAGAAQDTDQNQDLDEEFTEATPPPGDDAPDNVELEAHESHREPPRLLGVWCDAGHVTSPDNEECRVCGLPVPSQAPILVARPPLGVLIFDNGDRVTVDRPVVLGRDPKAMASLDPEEPVLHAVPSATGQVSRTHAEIRAENWDVVLTDLGAMNGTAVTFPGESPMAIEPNMPIALSPGARVDLGGESGFVFEVEA